MSLAQRRPQHLSDTAWPALAAAFAKAGAAFDGAVTLRPGQVTRLDRRGASAELHIAPGDEAFAAAVVRALAGPLRAPAAAAPASRALVELAVRVAARDVTVLITGATGTGKEVLARHVHDSSPRRGHPLVAVNCAALPEAMLEALLFGHERGAFTGATGAARGLFRAADGGSLFLDEIGEMPAPLQSKLLRALQEREILPIGATVPQPIDVRIIAATNRDLAAEVEAGRFRADLYYRLAVFPLAIAPLAARKEDLDALIAAILLRAPELVPLPSAAARAKLAAHDWPGNVRELENVLQRALVFAGETIEPVHIVFDARPAASGTALPAPLPLGAQVRLQERDAIHAALSACSGRRAAAARHLGISERTLRYKLAALAGRERAPATLQ